MKLDGTEEIKPTPFDAHESVVRGTHEHLAGEGYKPAEYEHQEYPKAVDHNSETGEPVIATDAKHEEQLAAEKGE
jgi:hypothetical protein